MKASTFGMTLVALVAAGACASANAAHVGVFIGGTVGVPYYYPVAPAPYYYYGPPVYPAVVAAPEAPPVYVEQGQGQEQASAGAPPQSSGSWYYCDASRAYYPYVKECPAGWRPVAPQPSPSN